MSDQSLSERDIRIQKLEQYQSRIGSAHPSQCLRTHFVKDVLEQFEKFNETSITIAGRLRYWRDHGKLIFAHIEDTTGKMQIALSAESLSAEQYTHLNLFDVGDIVEVTGKTFLTHSGEKSLLVKKINLLSKAIQPLPDKWHGIQDEEMRYRKRYLDMIMDPTLREMFIKKAKFWNSIRWFLLDEGFVEVETPVLESTPGGADAQPFATHHNALDIDMYLRISMGELWQKRLMVGGFEKTFEIGRQFRNEGISPEHLQDYTQMEFYWAYANYTDGMELVERMYKHCIMQTFGTLQFSINGFAVNLDQTWPTLDYRTAIQEKTSIDIAVATEAELVQACERLKLSVPDAAGKGRLIDTLWKHCRRQAAGPVFLINHPVEVSPLAKRRADHPEFVERFQVIIAGSELGNGYSELNDPLDQNARFEEQASRRAAGDLEAQMHDWDFVEALEYGMPPTCGFGLSERVFAFLMNKPIRECVMFPLLRPQEKKNASLLKETGLAVAVVNTGVGLERWQEMNTIAHLNAAFGARKGVSLFKYDTVRTKDGEQIKLNIQHAIMIKSATSSKEIYLLMQKARKMDLEIAEFTREMLVTTNDKKVAEMTLQKQSNEIERLGLLIFGKKKDIETLTSHLPLYS